MKIGVIGFQGAITEHLDSINEAMQKLKIDGKAFWLREKSQLSGADGLVIPGGESTTIGRLMRNSGIFNDIKEKGKKEIPILGTCAGSIILAKEGGKEIENTGQPLLKLMDIEISRNAFGRQKESFETDLDVPSFGEKPFPGVFIRAPAIERVKSDAKILAKYKNKIVAAEQNNLLALTFHPELTRDTRAHEYFLKKVRNQTL